MLRNPQGHLHAANDDPVRAKVKVRSGSFLLAHERLENGKRKRMVIGLKRGTVKIVPYQVEWEGLFEQERQLLARCIGNLVVDIQHVGSTAVPGLEAKPIIDIAIAVADPEMISRCTRPLAAIGYIDRGDSGKNGGYLFVKESAPGVRTYHLHLVTVEDSQWRTYLRFRDLLRGDETIRARYANLKARLKRLYPDDRGRYTSGKHDFIRSVLQ